MLRTKSIASIAWASICLLLAWGHGAGEWEANLEANASVQPPALQAMLGAIREPVLFAEVYDLPRLDRELADAGAVHLARRLGDGLREQAWLDQESRQHLEQFLQWTAGVPGAPGATAGVGLLRGLRSALLDAVNASHQEAVPLLQVLLGSAQGGVWFALEPAQTGGAAPLEWTLGWSLAPGAEQQIASEVLGSQLLRSAEGVVLERQLAPGGAELDLWKLSSSTMHTGMDLYVALRPGLALASSSRTTAERALAPRGAPSALLIQARARSTAEDELAFVFVGSAARELLLAHAGQSMDDQARALLQSAHHFSAGVRREGYQFATRARLELSNNQFHQRVTKGRTLFAADAPIPSDALAVFALPLTPWEYASGVLAMAGKGLADEDVRQLLAEVPEPLHALLQKDAFEGSTLGFVRPGSASVPTTHVALRMGPDVSKWLADLESRATTDLGSILVRTKEFEGARCVEFASASAQDGWQDRWMACGPCKLAMVRQGEWLVMADSLSNLKALLRQRAKPEARALGERAHALTETLLADRLARVRGGGKPAMFVQVRLGPVCEWSFQIALLAASFAGGANLEAFPQAREVSELAGDTTVLVISEPGALELRGQGLLGGLFLLL